LPDLVRADLAELGVVLAQVGVDGPRRGGAQQDGAGQGDAGGSASEGRPAGGRGDWVRLGGRDEAVLSRVSVGRTAAGGGSTGRGAIARPAYVGRSGRHTWRRGGERRTEVGRGGLTVVSWRVAPAVVGRGTPSGLTGGAPWRLVGARRGPGAAGRRGGAA